MSLPRDAALPQASLLIDPEAMTLPLERSLGGAATGRIDGLRVARVAYEPARRMTVHYEVVVAGKAENAVVFTLAGRDLAAWALRPALVDLARRIDGRSPAAAPIAYDPAVDALVTWLPFDPRLPALAETPAALAERLLRAGLSDLPGNVEPAIVPESYKPGARIVLRFGPHVLKAYGKEGAFARGATGLKIAARVPVPTPEPEAFLPDLRLTAQAAVDGIVPTPATAASRAGALVRRLQRAAVTPTRVASPESLLALGSDKAELAALVVPALGPRLARVLDRLRAAAPPADGLVLAHGDFDADQLVESGDGDYAVLDFDDVCVAAPAHDLATFLADVVRGADDDLEAVDAVREPLLAGYGARPAALEWHVAVLVLTRVLHPFQRLVPDWPDRMSGMVRTAEGLAG